MFGFTKFGPMEYVIHYQNGRVRREGRGLSFFYWIPTSTIVAVPMDSIDLPFVFNEITSDFQTVTIQGQITYRIADPRKAAELLDFTVSTLRRNVAAEREKLGQRVVNEAQTSTNGFVATLPLRQALRSAQAIGSTIMRGLSESHALMMLGVEPLSVAIVSVQPTPDMSRALEAESREGLQQEADQALYSRRNNAVEQERIIKENELNTEIAVEEKRRQIRETQTQADIAVEQQRGQLIELQTQNERKTAETRAFAVQSMTTALSGADWRTLLALGGSGRDPAVVMSHAFLDLAANAEKIGTLNISPELLESIVRGVKTE